MHMNRTTDAETEWAASAQQAGKPVGVKSAERVLAIFEALHGCQPGMTFTQVCGTLGLPKSSAHALLRVLEQRGYLTVQPETGRYQIGLRLYEVGSSYGTAINLREVTAPVLTMVSELCGETINVGVLAGRDAVWIDRREATHRYRIHTYIGMHMAAHRCALGKALLAGLDNAALERALGPHQPGSGPPPTSEQVEALKHELAEVRRSGVAYNFGEGVGGVHGVGVPVRNHAGITVASVSISVPEARMTPVYRDRLATLIREAVGMISSRLGYRSGSTVPTSADGLRALWHSPGDGSVLPVTREAMAGT